MEHGELSAPLIGLPWAIPFVALLASIALMPFINKHWWEKRYPWVSVGLGAIAASYYFLVIRQPARWLEGMADYVSFIVLLGSLFVVSGGIVIRIARKATPLANFTFLLLGGILANLFGTTGASMLLIRPFLRMNRAHLRPYHVIFFIFLVGNVGGSLTPIGDPPLFLGYLGGVPFWWVMQHMLAPAIVAGGLLLATFFVIDTLDHRRQERHHNPDAGPQVHILGIHNFLFILLVVGAVFQKGFLEELHTLRTHEFSWVLLGQLIVSREPLMVIAAVLSRSLTSHVIYQANEFSFGPIREVAILFLGIFATMVPALQYMQENASRMPLHTPGQFYFASGILSSILDNAPTYKTLLELRLAEVDPRQAEVASAELKRMASDKTLQLRSDLAPGPVRAAVESIVQYHSDDLLAGTVSRDELLVAFLLGMPALKAFIVAISAGSVFWGACTYIGNGPNFMIKSIADASGAHTPGFMQYILRYTLPILIPVYLLVWAMFFW